MVTRILAKLEVDELEDFSKFFMDIAKGVLGVPLVIYLVRGFSLLVLVAASVVNFILAFGLVILAIYLKRHSKRRRKDHG